MKNGFCNLSGFIFGSIFIFLWEYYHRIAQFSLAEKAVLVTQSFMWLHDNTKHPGQIPHTKRQMVSISGILE